MDKFYEKQAALCEAGKAMYHSGLVAGTWGNLSVRVDDEYCVVTPSGMDYDTLVPEDMVIMRMADYHTGSKRRPTIEYAMHCMLLRTRPEINAVVHTHSTYALTAAAVGLEVPSICDDQVQILGGSLKVSKRALAGTFEMAEAVVEAIKDRAGCLVSSHGAVTLGRSLNEALAAAQVLEKTCKVWVSSQAFGGCRVIADDEVRAMRDYFLNIEQFP